MVIRPSSSRHSPSSIPSTKTVEATPPFDPIQPLALVRCGHPVAPGVREPDVVVGPEQPRRRGHVAVDDLAAGYVVHRPPVGSSCRTRSSIAASTGPSRVTPDHAVTSAARRRAERAQVAPHDRLRVRRSRSGRPASGRPGRRPPRPDCFQQPRGGSCTRGASTRASVAERVRRHVREPLRPSPRRVPSPAAARPRARSATAARTSAGSRWTAGRVFWLTLRSRSCTGWVQPRSVSASSGTSRWMVPRIVSSRTSDRSSSPRVTSYGSKASSRAASERYGGRFSWACSPTRCATIAGTGTVVPLEQVLAAQQGAVEVAGGERDSRQVQRPPGVQEPTGRRARA